MSGSPKYASVRLTAERRRMLEEARARRIEERRRAAEERARRAAERHEARLAARVAKLAERRRQTLAEAGELTRRIDGVAGLTEQQRSSLRARAAEVERTVATGGVAVAAAAVRGLEHAMAAAEGRAEATAAATARTRELESVTELVSSVEGRLRFDAAGARAIDSLVQAARQVLHDPRRFDLAQQSLVDKVHEHMEKIEDAREAFELAELQAGQAVDALDALLEEAEAGKIELTDRAEAGRLRERIAADLGAGHAASARNGTASLAEVVSRMESEVEVVMDGLHAAELVIDAAVEALPAVGFQVITESVVQSGASVAFQIARADGAIMELRIDPADGGARVTYDGTASDYVIERGPDGMVARCDVTEELLERFHEHLVVEGVEAGELRWEGKPMRPAQRGARARDRTVTETKGRD